ncbi:MAG: hypothetical protein COA76_08990 [Moritella sp.]|nr:MAG: hypothetical protein COA76_08990 [Moritella sp.]
MMINNNPLLPIHRFFMGLYLCGSMGLFAVWFVPQGANTLQSGSTAIFMSCWAFFYAYSILVIANYKFNLTKLEWLILAFPIYFIVSTSWSLLPAKTLIYSISFLLNMLAIIALKRLYDFDELINLIVNLLFAMVVFSLVFSFLGVEQVKYIDPHNRPTILGTEPIRGMFNHKITAGLYAALGFNLSLLLTEGRKKYIYIVVFFLFTLLTGSATGLSILVIGLSLIGLNKLCLSLQVSKVKYLTCLLTFFGLVLYVSMVFGEDILLFLGRDPTLTGRTLLWSWGLDTSFDKPILGWGYLGYNGTLIAGSVAETYVEFTNYDAPHFHNSYIQMLVDGGYIFTCVLVISYFYALSNWYELSLKNISQSAQAYCFIILLLLIGGVFIHLLCRYNDFPTMMLMISLVFIPDVDSGQHEIT